MLKWKKLRVIAKSLNKGATIGAACEGANIRRVTLWRWRRDNTKIDEFINRLLDNQVQTVEDALFRRAVGYRYEEVIKDKEVNGDAEKKTARIIIKEVAGDTTAQMFFLMNRAPDRWADKRALINNYNINKNIVNPLGKLPDEELDGIIAGFTRRPGVIAQG